MEHPPQVLACPDPSGCPVAERVDGWGTATVAAGTALFRCYDTKWGYDEHNPGYGNARFSPFDADGTEARVPAMYVAATEDAALLETVLRAVEAALPGDTSVTRPKVYVRTLRNWSLAHVAVPAPILIADLRDPALTALGLTRPQVASSGAEHYPCTRRLARAIHADPRNVQGIVWHSRQAEIAAGPPAEAMVVFGDRYGAERGRWERVQAGIRNLVEGPGRALVEDLAARVGAAVVPDSGE